MKHSCGVCDRVFNNRDAVIKISRAVVHNANAAYIGLDESFDDEDIIHSDCLNHYAGDTQTVVEIEYPKVANTISDQVPSGQEDKITNTVGCLKNMGVSHNEAEKEVKKMLDKNPSLTTQEILCSFPYGV
jgi:hypothetical protein